MNTLKTPRLLLFILTLFLFLAACGSDTPTQEATPETLPPESELVPVLIHVYTPANLIDDNMSAELGEQTGIIVSQRHYTTDEELVSLIINPPEEVGLIIASNYAASVLRDQNLLTAFNPANVPNVLNIDGRFRNPAFDPNNQYCAAFTYGTLGLGYINGQGVEPTSWGDLFTQSPDSPAYGFTTIFNHPREAFGAALIHLGFSPNTSNETEINAAKQLILNAASSLADANSVTYWEDLATSKTTLVQAFSRDILAGQQVNWEMNFAFPSDGALLRTYSYCIPFRATPEQKRAAEAFINLALDQEWAVNSALTLEMPTTVMVDESLLDQESLNNPLIYPPNEVLRNAQIVYSLGAQEILYTTAWEDILNAIR
jgi:spermidine/putrescine transport system substrate-binding protein